MMTKAMIQPADQLTGRVLTITTPDGTLIDDIDTDMIYHNSHLAVTEIEQMAQHAFGNLENWQEFPRICRKGDILVCGRNFGTGSSRQHAVDCFIALGIQAIIARSFGAIYKRNAINSGLPIITAPELQTIIGCRQKSQTPTLTVNLSTGILAYADGIELKAQPMSGVQLDIYRSGNLFAFGKTL